MNSFAEVAIKIQFHQIIVTSSFLNPNRVAMLPYGTQPFNDEQPRKMSRLRFGSFEKTTRSCVSNHGHDSNEISTNRGK